jgi:hypothetical protein
MDPLVVAARFAAFVWFSQRNRQDREAAVRFAKDNWTAFLPLAHAGLGRLLLKIAAPTRRRRLHLSGNVSRMLKRAPAVAS